MKARLGSLAYGVVVTLVLAAFTIVPTRSTGAQRSDNAAVAVDADDIGGVVTSSNGPEAGVWVIAETKELPTAFLRIVVTDDRGRFLAWSGCGHGPQG